MKKNDAIRNEKNDIDFLVQLLDEICSYAIANDMSPDHTIITIAKNMIMLTEISTFDNWEKE